MKLCNFYFDLAGVQGAMWEWAPKFKAMLVFAEHRYYGQSMPYGNKSYEVNSLTGYHGNTPMVKQAVLLAFVLS